MKKLFFLVAMYAFALFAGVSPISAQNPDLTKEYKETLQKILDVSGASSMVDNILPQLMSGLKQSHLQQDETYWKEFAATWKQKIQDKVMEIYVPIYQRYLTLDELKEVVTFYESPVGQKLGKTAPVIMTEAMPSIQQLTMEMVREIMQKYRQPEVSFQDTGREQTKKRDQKLFDEGYRLPKDSIVVADRIYRHGMSTKPILYSIERRKKDTKVTFLQPIYFDWQWLHYGLGFKIVDKKTGDEYIVRGYDGGAPMGRLLIVEGFDSKYIYVSLLFPKLKKSVKEIDILELPHEKDVLPSNDDGRPKSYFDINVEDYLKTSGGNKKVYR